MRTSNFSILASFLLLWVLVITSCRKERNATLPPATQTGANTFGFTIDGEVWVPFSECGFGSDPCGKFLVNVYPP